MKGKGEEDMRDDTYDLFIVFEQWKPVPNFPYEVSNLGHLRKVNKDGSYRSIQACPNALGYCCVVLTDCNHNKKTFYLHRLVAEAFLPNPSNLPEINHLTEVKTFNEVYGIEYTTHKRNVNYGTRNQKIGDAHARQVDQFTLDGRLVKTWKSMREAGDHGFKSSCVSSCCRGKQKTYKGFVWRYKEN